LPNAGYTFVDLVPSGCDGICVLDYYARRHVRADRDQWSLRIESGRVTRDGRVLACQDMLHTGDRLEYSRPPWDEPDVPMEAPILHEDPDVVVFHKPAGLPVNPGSGCQDRTLLTLARSRFGPEIRSVHRLDTGTSGAVAFARSAVAARHLCAAFAARQVHKTYLAIVAGLGLPDKLVLDLPIGLVAYPPLGFVSGVSVDGRQAFSEVAVLRRDPASDQSLVQVIIATGRSQQIRVHLAWAGFPLAGDSLYGPGGTRPPVAGKPVPKPGDGGFLLHAWKLSLPRRTSTDRIEVVAAPPQAMEPVP
jgi:23S rRNA pseudouridine1911/1915/1917 synthase